MNISFKFNGLQRTTLQASGFQHRFATPTLLTTELSCRDFPLITSSSRPRSRPKPWLQSSFPRISWRPFPMPSWLSIAREPWFKSIRRHNSYLVMNATNCSVRKSKCLSRKAIAASTIIIARTSRKHRSCDGWERIWISTEYGAMARNYRSRLALIIDSSDDAIISKNLDGTITSWNKGAERIYGYTSEEVIGKPISLLAPNNRADEITEILQKIAEGESIEHYESERVAKNGRHLNVSISVSPLRDEIGRA